MSKQRKSKYGFASLEVGKYFDCDALDMPSMQSSLSHYNKNKAVKIKVEITELSKSKVRVTRVELKKEEAL